MAPCKNIKRKMSFVGAYILDEGDVFAVSDDKELELYPSLLPILRDHKKGAVGLVKDILDAQALADRLPPGITIRESPDYVIPGKPTVIVVLGARTVGMLSMISALAKACATSNLFAGWEMPRWRDSPRPRAPKTSNRDLHPRMRPKRWPKWAANWHRTRAQTTKQHMACGRIDWE
jgi:hypothetical protein